MAGAAVVGAMVGATMVVAAAVGSTVFGTTKVGVASRGGGGHTRHTIGVSQDMSYRTGHRTVRTCFRTGFLID